MLKRFVKFESLGPDRLSFETTYFPALNGAVVNISKDEKGCRAGNRMIARRWRSLKLNASV